MSIPDISDPKKNESQLTLVRKYLQEIVIVCLAACTVYLFLQVGKLNDRFNAYLQTTVTNLVPVVQSNTNALNKVSELINLRVVQVRDEEREKETK